MRQSFAFAVIETANRLLGSPVSLSAPGRAWRPNVANRFPSSLIVAPIHFTRATLRTRSVSPALLTHCWAGGSVNAAAGEIGLRFGLGNTARCPHRPRT